MKEKNLLNVQHTTRKETQTTTKISIGREALLSMLEGAGHTAPPGAKIDIYVSVPSGGDWSSTDLDIDKETPIQVRFLVQSVEVEVDGKVEK